MNTKKTKDLKVRSLMVRVTDDEFHELKSLNPLASFAALFREALRYYILKEKKRLAS